MSANDIEFFAPSLSRELHKFGGSSLLDPDCFRRVAQILEKHSGVSDLIVVSAAGKTTNCLIEWLLLVEKNTTLADGVLQNVWDYQRDLIENVIDDLQKKRRLFDALSDDVKAIAQACCGSFVDDPLRAWVQGFGELWSARLLCALLEQRKMPSVACDSRSFLRAERAALPEVDCASSLPALQATLAQYPQTRIVITGFMAQNNQGETVLLGRNGSDYSATVIGVLAGVSRVTIWSDVAGVYSADPRIVLDAFLLPELRLDEATELARLGSPVLHSRTLQPMVRSTVSVNLRCSYSPDPGMTRIERVLDPKKAARIITSLDNVYLLRVNVALEDDFSVVQEDIERLLVHKQLQALAVFVNEDNACLQLAYSDELASSALHELQSSGVALDVQLLEGYSMIAAVGVGVIDHPGHREAFYQQLSGQLVAFIDEPACGLSLVAILHKTDTAALAKNMHRALFQTCPYIDLGVVLDELTYTQQA